MSLPRSARLAPAFLASALLALPLACAPTPVPPPTPSISPATVAREPCAVPPCRSARLQAALEELASNVHSPDAHLSPEGIRLAMGRAGYAGNPVVLSARGGPGVGAGLAASIPDDAREIALAERHFSASPGAGSPGTVGPGAEGQGWAVVAWSTSPATLSALPRQVDPGAGVTLVVGGMAGPLALFHGLPDGSVATPSLSGPRLLRLEAPGEHRLEVVDGEEIVLLFSVYVGMEVPPALPFLAGASAKPSPGQPEVVAEGIRAGVDDLRAAQGLPSLQNFPLFQDVLDAQAACLAPLPVLLHQTEACPSVADRSRRRYFPRAIHREDLGRGASAEEILAVIRASPGHLQNLLCRDCSHLGVGVASGADGSFTAVIELLAFPSGEPRRR